MLQLYLFQVFPFFLILDIKTSLQVVTWTFSAFLPRKQQITQFRSKNPTKTGVSVVRVRSGALFSSSSSCPRNLLLLSATNHFRVLDPFFLHHVFRRENCVKTAIVLCIDEEGVMMIFDELEKLSFS